MTALLKALLARVLDNPKSTIASIVPLILAVGLKFGFSISMETLTEILTGLYAIILLFFKDSKEEVKVDKSTVSVEVPTSATTSAKLDSAVDSIMKRG